MFIFFILGNLLSIPDAVLGMTFLAAGGCLPESISLVIMMRKGNIMCKNKA